MPENETHWTVADLIAFLQTQPKTHPVRIGRYYMEFSETDTALTMMEDGSIRVSKIDWSGR